MTDWKLAIGKWKFPTERRNLGKTKIQVIDDSREKEEKSSKGRSAFGRKKKQSLKEKRGVRVPGLKGGERVVAVGGELPPEKPETTEKEEKPTGDREQKTRAPRPPRQRGKKYLEARAKVDPAKTYPPEEAAKLVKETSISRFNLPAGRHGGSVELHLVLNKGGLKSKLELPHGQPLAIRTEKKAPLAHLVVGSVEQPEKEIAENIEAVFAAVGKKNVKKAVVSASMGPGIKISV